MPNELLTTAQVAQRLSRSVYTINRYVRDGQLRVEMQFPGSKGARLFHPAEIARFEDAERTEAAQS